MIVTNHIYQENKQTTQYVEGHDWKKEKRIKLVENLKLTKQ
jgi:hypothetical protein